MIIFKSAVKRKLQEKYDIHVNMIKACNRDNKDVIKEIYNQNFWEAFAVFNSAIIIGIRLDDSKFWESIKIWNDDNQ